MSDWVSRAAVADDEPCLASMWLKAYAHSRDAAQTHPGATKAGSPDEVRFWRAYQPIVTALLRGADVTVLCDPERSTYQGGKKAVIWAWSCTWDERVFWVGIKRAISAASPELAADMARDLLGPLLGQRAVMEFHPMDLHRLGLIPEQWRSGGAWLRSMLGLSSAVGAGDELSRAVGAYVLDPERAPWSPEGEAA